MINGSYTQFTNPYSQNQLSFRQQSFIIPSPIPQALNSFNNSATSQTLNNYQQEIEKLKRDKKHSDFYIMGMATVSILTAIGTFIARRTEDIRV